MNSPNPQGNTQPETQQSTGFYILKIPQQGIIDVKSVALWVWRTPIQLPTFTLEQCSNLIWKIGCPMLKWSLIINFFHTLAQLLIRHLLAKGGV
jgi:hypothetical protein